MAVRDFFDYESKFTATLENAQSSSAAAVGFFDTLSEEEIETFLKFTAQLKFTAGSAIGSQDGSQRHLFFILSGGVKARFCENAFLEAFNAGSFFGISSFLDPHSEVMSAQAAADTEVLVLSHDNFIRLAAWNPRLALALLQHLGSLLVHRLRGVNILL